MVLRGHTALAWTLGAATLKFRLTAVPGLIMFSDLCFEFKLIIGIVLCGQCALEINSDSN